MADNFDDLTEMRCRSCGRFLGFRKRTGRFIFWCSEECADTIMPKYTDTQERDELAIQLALEGVGVMAIANLTDLPYQMVQQNLARRKIGATKKAS